jgi:hypothetical protein
MRRRKHFAIERAGKIPSPFTLAFCGALQQLGWILPLSASTGFFHLGSHAA